MAEYEAVAEELHSLFSKLPELVLERLRYPDQYRRVGDEIRECLWQVTSQLDVDMVKLVGVMDDQVDDARYYNWVGIPEPCRVMYAQLLALFNTPGEFISASELEKAELVFVDLLEYARKLLSRLLD